MSKVEKKIAIRKAPTEKANTHNEGYTSIGADDNMYIVNIDGIMYIVEADEKGIKWLQKVNPDKVKPEKPNAKREPTVYNIFVCEQMAKMRAENETLSPLEHMKIIDTM